ncbi:hypothetical protein [Sphingobacterium sp. 1.A.5]|uniref:hypothetical protein n=1 Tax=Sphingobacterium sp. 1.A.5 TaxID=2044604 RepID=UPI000C0C0632|nr:hypothetical protein [Sphingobacterium sp. 1.A.5]
MDLTDYNKIVKHFFEDVPQINLGYIKGFTSETGIYQHAKFNIPDYHHGYCLDDNSRALLLLLMFSVEENKPIENGLIKTYLSYIYYSQEENGWFRNFMSYDLKFLESIGSEDSMGRTIWTLGYLIAHKPFLKYHPIAKETFDRIINHVVTFKSIRAVAYSILGILYFLEKYPNQKSQLEQLSVLVEFLVKEFESASSDNWPWYEGILSYDNAIIPLSILKAGNFLNNDEVKEIGLKSSIFLDHILFRNGHLSLIGNNGWLTKENKNNTQGQQPIEVASIILWYKELSKLNIDVNASEKIRLSFAWFLGVNDHNESLFDLENMACFDGLEPYGVNKNMGAESNIAFWMSYLHAKSYCK